MAVENFCIEFFLDTRTEWSSPRRQSVRVQRRLRGPRPQLGGDRRAAVRYAARLAQRDLHQPRQPRGPRHEPQVRAAHFTRLKDKYVSTCCFVISGSKEHSTLQMW